MARKRPTDDGSSGSPGNRVKPKNQDLFRLRRLLRAARNGNASTGDIVRMSRQAARGIRRTDRHNNFSTQDARVANRAAHAVRQLDSDVFSDAATRKMANLLHRTISKANPVATGAQVGVNLGTGGPKHHGHNGPGKPRHNNNGGKPRRHGGPGRPGKPGGINYNPQNYRESRGLRALASQMVNADANDQLRDIRRVMQALSRGGNANARQLRTQGRRTRGDLRTIFGEVADYTRAQNQGINQNYGNLIDQLGNNNADSNANIAGQTEAQRGALTGEMDRLGIGDAGVGNFDSEAGFAQSQFGQGQGDMLDNVRMQQSGANAVGDLLGSTIQGEKASQIGQSWNTQNDALAANRDDIRDQLADLRSNALDVRQSRGGELQQLLLQLQDRDYNRWAEQSQNNFLNQMQANAFNLNVDQFNAGNQWNRMQLLQQQASARTLAQAQRRAKHLNRSGGHVMQNINDLLSSIGFHNRDSDN